MHQKSLSAGKIIKTARERTCDIHLITDPASAGMIAKGANSMENVCKAIEHTERRIF
jgi:hypothetical protein